MDKRFFPYRIFFKKNNSSDDKSTSIRLKLRCFFCHIRTNLVKKFERYRGGVFKKIVCKYFQKTRLHFVNFQNFINFQQFIEKGQYTSSEASKET